MIQLTRINGDTVVVNAELIEFVEETPDTVLTLTTGKKLMVKEPASRVVELVKGYRRSLTQDLRLAS